MTPGAASARGVVIYASLIALVLVAWGAILFVPEALFWDDWVLANDDTLTMTRELGLPWVGPIDIALFALGPWSFKVIVLASTAVIACLTYTISGRGLGLSQGERVLLAALVAVLPVFASRPLVSISLYSWSLAFFVVAWYLIVSRPASGPAGARFYGAAALFFASYTTPSLLPFTALPVLHLVLLAYDPSRALVRQALAFVRRYWMLFLAPVLFWVLRALFLQPYGLYENYNSIGGLGSLPIYVVVTLAAVALALIATVGALVYRAFGRRPRDARTRRLAVALLLSAVAASMGAVLYVTRVSTSPLSRVVPVVIVISAVVVALGAILDARSRRDEPVRPDPIPVVAAGLIALTLGMLPYLLVGKLPSFAEWETRHQLLMPLGIAAITVAAFRALAGRIPARILAVLAGATVALFTVCASFLTLSLVADWHKQEQVIAQLRESEIIRDASTILVTDESIAFNFDNRPAAYYEYTGWMKTAFGDETRLALPASTLQELLDNELGLEVAPGRYGFGDWVQTDRSALLVISPLDGASWWDLLLDHPSVTIEVTAVSDLGTL